MAPAILNPVADETLLKEFLRLTGISVQSLRTGLDPDLIVSRGAIDALVNAARKVEQTRTGTLLVLLGAINARLKERGERPLSLAGLRHLAGVRPSPSSSVQRDREIRKAYSL